MIKKFESYKTTRQWKMMMNRLSMFKIELLAIILLLSGCGGIEAAGKIAKVIADPKIQVGDKKEQPTEVSFSLVGEDVLNLNFEGDATQIQVDVFQLQSNSKFLAADYDGIASDPQGMLGRSYISQEEYFVEPSGNQYIESIELDPKTKYLGVVAHYSNIDEVIWKKIVKVNPLGEKLHFLILLKDREIKLDRMDDK